jgi:hypothetical protein
MQSRLESQGPMAARQCAIAAPAQRVAEPAVTLGCTSTTSPPAAGTGLKPQAGGLAGSLGSHGSGCCCPATEHGKQPAYPPPRE